ncbi:hypothetical protein GJ699_15940 [Duganella sp. FT80W]|uniref:HTH tetR-type domain-containing protein n=1 Tax=Duganella guangzhouensis TaxID=2666084 RepID=A0A6I2L3R0_9BURK|nr:TetR/AcrR family transcriptional regulator [Duganella guangzhouensis]MRW91484.1 hypothetical protein [Duganella guangzhouensis]
MTQPSPARKSRKAPSDEALLTAACAIVQRDGLAGLTLRPLAEALGVSVTVLSNHYGARIDVMAAVCRAASAQERALLDGWHATLTTLTTSATPGAAGAPGTAAAAPLPQATATPCPLSPIIAAELAEAILDDLATRQRAVSLLYLEILHACSWDATLAPAFATWSQARSAFWQAFAAQAGLSPLLTASGWWQGYVIAELAYSMALNGQPSYRLLRRLCLRRLCAGGLAAANDNSDAALFGVLQQQMSYDHAVPAPAPAADWSAEAARASGMRLAAQGVNGVTHRAVAADIGIPHTTLSYRYPTQHELVSAGLESIIAHILAAMDADDLDTLQRSRSENQGKKLDLARASFAVALAATRMPELASRTLSMRSRRGGNLVKVFRKYLPDAQGIDALCAQVVSLGLLGLTNTEPPGEASEQTVATAFGAAARWLAQTHSA